MLGASFFYVGECGLLYGLALEVVVDSGLEDQELTIADDLRCHRCDSGLLHRCLIARADPHIFGYVLHTGLREIRIECTIYCHFLAEVGCIIHQVQCRTYIACRQLYWCKNLLFGSGICQGDIARCFACSEICCDKFIVSYESHDIPLYPHFVARVT